MQHLLGQQHESQTQRNWTNWLKTAGIEPGTALEALELILQRGMLYNTPNMEMLHIHQTTKCVQPEASSASLQQRVLQGRLFIQQENPSYLWDSFSIIQFNSIVSFTRSKKLFPSLCFRKFQHLISFHNPNPFIIKYACSKYFLMQLKLSLPKLW